LGRHKAVKKISKSSNKPRRPGKDRLKEQHPIKVLSGRQAPKPILGQKTENKPAKKPGGPRKRPQPLHGINAWLMSLVDSGKSPKWRWPKGKKPKKPKVKFQKWDLTHEPWNFKRSPSLRRLKKSLIQVKRGKCPYFKFKDLFRKIKIRTLGRYNRVMSILEDGLLVTARPIGIRLTAQIRRVRKLSFRDLETLVSKLPFWATSYRPATMYRLACIAGSYMSSENLRNSLSNSSGGGICPRAPIYSVVRTPRTNRHRVGR
jgi:hypothetical protein